ncbi:hypothetical protein QOT17_020415 [Balamuthia mandrillaris]
MGGGDSATLLCVTPNGEVLMDWADPGCCGVEEGEEENDARVLPFAKLPEVVVGAARRSDEDAAAAATTRLAPGALLASLFPHLEESKRLELAESTLLLGSFLRPPFLKNQHASKATFYMLRPFPSSYLQTSASSSSLRWTEVEQLIQRFEEHQVFLCPLSLQLLRWLQRFSRSDDFGDFVKHCLERSQLLNDVNDERMLVGVQMELEYAPNMLVVPVLSNTLPPFDSTNLVMFLTKTECLIVDPGASLSAGAPHFLLLLDEFVFNTSSSLPPRTLHIFLTHHHKDHWEGLVALSQLDFSSSSISNQLIVYAHAKTFQRLERLLPSLEGAQALDLFTNSQKWKLVSITSNDRIVLSPSSSQEDGQGLVLDILQAEGHTDGHLVLWESKGRTLIAGDHIVGQGSASLDAVGGGDMTQYLATTRFLMSLAPRLAVPAHGPPSYRCVALLKEYLRHRQAREDAIVSSIQAGARNVEEVVAAVYKDISPALWKPAAANVMLHIRKLQNEEKLPPSFSPASSSS